MRRLRRRIAKTLSDISKVSGLSKGYLSQVERGYVSPSLSSLASISSALGVTPRYFLDSVFETAEISRADRRTFFGIPGSDSTFAYLKENNKNLGIEAALVRIAIGDGLSNRQYLLGEQFILVVEGEVRLTVDDKTLVLHEGDSAQYKSSIFRGWESTGKAQAILLWIATPKLFWSDLPG